MQENGEACCWWLGQGIMVQACNLFWTNSGQSGGLEGLAGGDPGCGTRHSPGLDRSLPLSSPSPLLSMMQSHFNMSIHKTLLLCHRGRGSALAGLGKGEGCSAAMGNGSYTPEVGGTEHAAYYSSCQWLSAVAGRGG